MRLEKASLKAIRYACMNFHYAKRIPVYICAYSVFNAIGQWCGVIVYGLGSGDKMGKHFDLPLGSLCELVRVALNGKQESTSKALSISLKLLKRDAPLIRLVYSFADVDQRHYGTIYQATNWIYLGQNEPYTNGFVLSNKVLHRRSATALLKRKNAVTNLENVKRYIDPSATISQSAGKRKYVYCFDKKVGAKYRAMGKPYPKNAVVAHMGEQLATSQEGAFDSTSPLQNTGEDQG